MVDDRTLERWLPASVVALTGDLIRATLWMLVVVALFSCGRIYLRLALLTYGRPGGNDFTILYYTARMVRDGWPMYGDLPAEYALSWHLPFLGNLNPPQFQILLMPLVPLGYRGAVVVWILLNVVAVALTAWLIVSELTRPLTLRTTLITLLAVFASAAWTSVAVTAEMSALLLLPFTAAWRAARHGRFWTAGVLLGVCASLKLFLLAFVVWFIVVRAWRGVAGVAAGFVGSMGLGVAVYGPAAVWTMAGDIHAYRLVGAADEYFHTGIGGTHLPCEAAVSSGLFGSGVGVSSLASDRIRRGGAHGMAYLGVGSPCRHR